MTEAVALGVPVLTTDCAGMNEILANEEYGWIVENNESALTEALEALLDDRTKIDEMKTRVQKRSLELISANQIQEYLDLFNEVAK